jgi:hypothetical protein
MGHLQKVSTGHLLKVSGGHLAKECCCGVCCDLDCANVYTAVVSGITKDPDCSTFSYGQLSLLSGTHTCSWAAGSSDCNWVATNRIALSFNCDESYWYARGYIASGSGYEVVWKKAHVSGCDITGVYDWVSCYIPGDPECCDGTMSSVCTVS